MYLRLLLVIMAPFFEGQIAQSQEASPIIFDCSPIQVCDTTQGCYEEYWGGLDLERLIYQPRKAVWFSDNKFTITREIVSEPIVEGVNSSISNPSTRYASHSTRYLYLGKTVLAESVVSELTVVTASFKYSTKRVYQCKR